MFTGIVAATGKITHITPLEKGLRLTVDAGALDLADVAIGDSISHNGVCLTVVALSGNNFNVDVSQETLSCTVGLDAPGEVNLEKAMRLSDRLGGHLVSGHVDGVGSVARIDDDGASQRWHFHAPAALMRYIAVKGSICIDGTSLTVNTIEGDAFGVTLIPHTLIATTFGARKVGDPVNFEVDLIAR